MSVIEYINKRLSEIEDERSKLLKAKAALEGLSFVEERAPTLSEAIKRILVKPMFPREIHKQLDKQGHPFRGKNPRMSVYITLVRHPELFKKIGDGKWKLLDALNDNAILNVHNNV